MICLKSLMECESIANFTEEQKTTAVKHLIGEIIHDSCGGDGTRLIPREELLFGIYTMACQAHSLLEQMDLPRGEFNWKHDKA